MSRHMRHTQASAQPDCLMEPATCSPPQAPQAPPSSSSAQLQVCHVPGSAGGLRDSLLRKGLCRRRSSLRAQGGVLCRDPEPQPLV